MIFLIAEGTADSVVWKATVRIGCCKVDVETENVDSYRLLNLRQFHQVSEKVVLNYPIAEIGEHESIAPRDFWAQ